jgi:sugar lactone lactonase YvrE
MAAFKHRQPNPPRAGEGVTPAVSILADDGNLCGEAPLWDATRQTLYWTDIVGCKFYALDLHSRRKRVLLENFEVCGCAFDGCNGFTLANSSGVWIWRPPADPVLIASEFAGMKLKINDCIADPEGRLLAGSAFYTPAESYPLGKLFCIHPNGKVQILDEGFHLANGLGFSPDGRTLYFTDSIQRTIYSYLYDPLEGRVGDRRMFVRVDKSSGIPDGLTVDAEGYVWSAEWYGGCICRYDPDGKLERRIALPAKQTSSLAFGGPDLTDIFVTSAAQPEPMPIMPPGYDPYLGCIGGALYHLNFGIAGCVEYRTRFHVR